MSAEPCKMCGGKGYWRPPGRMGNMTMPCVECNFDWSKPPPRPAELVIPKADPLACPADSDPFPFGKYKGKTYEEVPDGYYGWMLTMDWIDQWPQVMLYIKTNLPELL